MLIADVGGHHPASERDSVGIAVRWLLHWGHLDIWYESKWLRHGQRLGCSSAMHC